jgi:hypothetical protein
VKGTEIPQFEAMQCLCLVRPGQMIIPYRVRCEEQSHDGKTESQKEDKLASLDQEACDVSQNNGGCWLSGAGASRLDQKGLNG